MNPLNRLAALRGFLLDLDGVVYRGEEVMPGAVEFFAYLRANALRYCMITNNSTRTPEQSVEKLARLGIPARAEDVITSSEATARYLTQEAPPKSRVFVIGGYGLHECIRRAGFATHARNPDYVVIGMDVKLSYQKLALATKAIRGGAKFVASNADPTLPTEDGELPGAGAIVAALRATTGVEPTVVGKPQPMMLEMALERLRLVPKDVANVGDRLETDVVAGKRLGLGTVLVLSGVTSEQEVEGGSARPDFVFPDLAALLRALAEARTGLGRDAAHSG